VADREVTRAAFGWLQEIRATPTEVYQMLMDSRKHQSLCGEKANISNRVAGRFRAWTCISRAST
jgi:hypothetical protein